jgi:protein phosphatase
MVTHLMPYKLTAFGLSDIGLVRQNNEDVLELLPEEKFFILADGMGGHQAGEIASRETVDTLCRIVKNKISPIKEKISSEKLGLLLGKAIQHVNLFIYKMGQVQQELRGMGTTLCCLLFVESGLIYAHVGDSRIYCFRDSKLQQLTEDDSLVRELISQGQLSTEQATDFMYKNIITKAIGTRRSVKATVASREIQPGDRYLMCSDGLSDLLTTQEIESILLNAVSPQEATEILIATANLKGGQDNITVVLVHVDNPHDDSEETKNIPG